MKRSAKYVGSPLWRKKDLRVETYTNGVGKRTVRATDLGSGIVVWDHSGAAVDVVVAKLAHRVRQLTT